NSTSTSEYLTMAYAFDGVAICSNAFLKLYNLSKNRLNGLKNHYKDNDIVPKVHLSKGKKVSHNKFSFETILKVLTFLKIYANLNGRHFKRDTKAIIYLPTKDSYTGMHEGFLCCIGTETEDHIGYSTFTKESTGLNASRQWYLYDQIRDLVQNPDKRNNICPEPSVPRP
ncbi:22313_t:CDS:2, partial [Entrophospora sp. SA101]